MSISKTTTDITTLKINYLTQEMYDAALANNQINENELYVTPNESEFIVTSSSITTSSDFSAAVNYVIDSMKIEGGSY